MTCKSSAKTVSFLLCTTLFYVFGMSAHAQIEDEIIVTATKKEESAQDVGISLSAFTEEGLELGGVDDVSRLEFLVPGVNFAYVGNDAKFNVRGANSTNTFGDNSSIVGAFVDGVYKARASQQTRAFFDVSRVEFLKGPQGTLYGRNTFAGALNLYTNAPDLDEYSAGAEFGYGRFDRAEFEGFVNVPVNDTFGIRVAGFYDKSDGYIDNTAGPDVGAQDDKGVRVSTLWQPNDNFNAIARYTYIVEDGREAGLFGYILTCRNEQANGLTDPLGPRRDCANPVRGSGGAPVYGETSGPWQIAQDYVPLVDLKEHVAQLELNMDFGGIVGKSITSWTDFRNNIGFDFDFSPLPNQVGGYDEEAEYFTQEFQILSDYDSPLQWQAGVYYSKDELFQSFTLYQATMRDDSVRGTVTLNQGEDDETTLTLLDGTPITSRDINLNGFFADSQVIDTEYFGIYGQVEYSLGDNLRLIGGLRYNSEDKELTGGGSNFTGDLNGDGGVDRVVNVVDGFSGATNLASLPRNNAVFSYNFDATDQIIVEPDTYDNVSWRAGVEFDVNPDVLVYATAATGFLSGALSSGGSGSSTDEQESLIYEAGFKSRLADNRLQLNAAVHLTEYTNLLAQEQLLTDIGTTLTVSRNGGEIQAWGVEFDAIWAPTDQLTLTANGAFLDSEYERFGATNPYQLYNNRIQSFIDLAGETTPWSPDFTFGASAAYEIDLGDKGTLTPYGQFYYSDGYNTSNLLAVDPAHDQDSFTKTDLRLIWDAPSENYSVEAYIENLEDEAVLGRGNNGSDDQVQTGFLYPQNYGVKFKARF